MSYPCAVFPEEVDLLVSGLRRFPVADIGTPAWFDQNEAILRLTQQSYIEASTNQEEVVKERLVAEDRLPVLVHEMYCVLVWRSRVLPKLLVGDLEATFVLYSVLYYEMNVAAVLETVLYHRNSCEALGGVVLDLIDYCASAVGLLIGMTSCERVEGGGEDLLNESGKEEVERMNEQMAFKIGMKCLSILGSLMSNLDVLPLSAASRVTKVHDVPCLVAEILHVKPWLRKRKGIEKFVNDSWKPVYGEEITKVTKTEAQTWFCLFGLLFNESTARNYEINDFRQREIGKCVGLMNEQLLDQLPALAQLKQFLCTLQMSGNGSGGSKKSDLLLEELPEIKDGLIEEARKFGWSKIVQAHKEIFVDLTQEQLTSVAKRLNAAYNTDLLEKINSGTDDAGHRICSTCKKSAEKRCSKCESVFYCSRECQVADWPRHKELCHQLKSL
ncbi:zinc finger MYND domain-containing protein 10 [Culex quinquefasciatus]|uniref:Zinc finger MYND domain-containing protein 10 n=1 Tax=Culex quinquefasciatus TaxID=7176 RepID=B0WML2_CULQU|nr:zinc finger MYND domain-containing protein 10 [Culex quinquefasciatus]|eukprot:XP_001849946.1 zinc finger MYND domain-containing protein 10 [Culex quinquefasciatus]